jgi:hypothetical protein
MFYWRSAGMIADLASIIPQTCNPGFDKWIAKVLAWNADGSLPDMLYSACMNIRDGEVMFC